MPITSKISERSELARRKIHFDFVLLNEFSLYTEYDEREYSKVKQINDQPPPLSLSATMLRESRSADTQDPNHPYDAEDA